MPTVRRLKRLASHVAHGEPQAELAVVAASQAASQEPPLRTRLDDAIAAGAVAVIALDEGQRRSFARNCPELEPECEHCGVAFVRSAHDLVESTLDAAQLQLLRWFLGVGDCPADGRRMPSAILFRDLGGQAPPDCPTPNIPPALPAGSRRGPSGKVAAKPDSISEAWMMGVRHIRTGASDGADSDDDDVTDGEEEPRVARLPQNLVPVPGREQVLGNEGSAEHLGWHCDGGFDRAGLQEDRLGN